MRSLLLSLAMLLLGADPPGTDVVVAFDRRGFDPPRIELRRGERLVFHNVDPGEEPLTVVAADGSFESRPLATHGEWAHRFGAPGEHEFFVRGHAEARGVAVVREGRAAAPGRSVGTRRSE